MLSALLIVCSLLSTTGSEWVKLPETLNGKLINVITDGIWSECTYVEANEYTCRDVMDQPAWMGSIGDWILFTRAFMVLSILSSVTTIICVILSLIWKPRISYYMATMASLFTGIFLTCALIIFHEENGWTQRERMAYSHGWSFHIAIVGVVNALLVFFILLFAIYNDYKESQHNESLKNENA